MSVSKPEMDLLLVGPEACRLSRSLKTLGYRCKKAKDGEDALEALAGADVLGVIFEVQVDDIEISSLIRVAAEHQPHAALVLMADPVRSGEIVSALSLGADAFVPAPVDVPFLAERLERQLQGALLRWRAADADEGGLFVDEAMTFEWSDGTDTSTVAGTQETGDSSIATISRVPASVLAASRVGPQSADELPARRPADPEGTVREPAPEDPVSYDPAHFPPAVHEAPTGPVSELPDLHSASDLLDSDLHDTDDELPLDAARDHLSGMLRGPDGEVRRPPGPSVDSADDEPPDGGTSRIRIQVTNPGAAMRVRMDGSLEGDLVDVVSSGLDEAAEGFDEDEETRTLNAEPDLSFEDSESEPTAAARPLKSSK